MVEHDIRNVAVVGSTPAPKPEAKVSCPEWGPSGNAPCAPLCRSGSAVQRASGLKLHRLSGRNPGRTLMRGRAARSAPQADAAVSPLGDRVVSPRCPSGACPSLCVRRLPQGGRCRCCHVFKKWFSGHAGQSRSGAAGSGNPRDKAERQGCLIPDRSQNHVGYQAGRGWRR